MLMIRVLGVFIVLVVAMVPLVWADVLESRGSAVPQSNKDKQASQETQITGTRITGNATGTVTLRLTPKNPTPEAPSKPDANPENREFGQIMTSHPLASKPSGKSPVVKTVKSKVNRVYSQPQRATVINPGHAVGPVQVTVSGTAQVTPDTQ